ncbi:MAG: alkaline phosphatase family protein, partial [Candidatus Dormibacteraeota bacterium]|nr:alkaline phosphatase family protein [Candidatus Dormibacteraeota bacterium]
MHRLVKSGLTVGGIGAVAAGAAAGLGAHASADPNVATATPIQHVVVIFQENVSFDHYFGTYPNARNDLNDGEPFTELQPNNPQPTVNGLNPGLLTNNPNGWNPVRLTRSQALTCDQGHDYQPEQKAYDFGGADQFIPNTGNNGPCAAPDQTIKNVVMDYYDGNTVTALWNYAQQWSMNDNSFNTQYGPSTPGALNLISGQTHGATLFSGPSPSTASGSAPSVVNGNGTVFGDDDPYYDDCSAGTTIKMSSSNKNIGDLLNQASVTWGWFQGGFAPTSVSGTGIATCGSTHTNIGGATPFADYSAHHEPFQYYASTANQHHLPPASLSEVGNNGQANHQYDLSWFYQALNNNQLPAVSFLKAAKYQDGHAGYSDPLDEQTFLVNTINQIENSNYWNNTAIVINYDDSDGWYDHVMPPLVNTSQDPAQDALTGSGKCGSAAPLQGYEDRCGYGPRLPYLVLSPYAKQDFIDNTLTDQSSTLRFIEDNWLNGERIGGGSFDQLAGSIDNMFDFQHPHGDKLTLD